MPREIELSGAATPERGAPAPRPDAAGAAEAAPEPAPASAPRARRRARRLVAREVLRTLGQALLLLPRALLQLGSARRLRAELLRDLATTPELAPDGPAPRLPARPLRILVSCAEPSGETHAVNLVRALRAAAREAGAPEPTFTGLGGARLSAEGVRTGGDPVASARMGFSGVLGALPHYLGLLTDAATELVLGQDLFIGVDSPALHVPLAHMARAAGVPAVQHITPQYWGWAPWRVAGFRRAVDLALTILPFEPAWFARHGVRAAHVGHPLLDEENEAPTPAAAGPPGARTLALLPGSRGSVIDRNLPVMLAALREPLARHPEWRVRVLQRGEAHRERVLAHLASCGLEPDRVALSGDLEGELVAADAALSVSGTILVHLLRRRVPAVVLYRLEGALQAWMGRRFLLVPWFSSVNLLAGEEVYPEFSFPEPAPPAALVAALERLLADGSGRAATRARLEAVAARLGPPGASRRAALAALSLVAAPAAPTGPEA
jgi:lipid-A-disaccharide synthase